MENPNGSRPQRGFSLGAIFLAITLFAVVISQFGWGIARAESLRFKLSFAMAGGGTGGLLFGIMIGLYHYRRFYGAMVGMLTGLVFGALMGPICAAAFQNPMPALVASFGGSLALIVCAAVFRQLNARDAVTDPESFKQMLAKRNAEESPVAVATLVPPTDGNGSTD